MDKADRSPAEPENRDSVTLFLCGDVMTGRGIDQILPHPGRPWILEPYARSALDYVTLAEAATGPLPRPAEFAYPWGDALIELDRLQPDARIVNLEAAVTRRSEAWPDKDIHYRMHPANLPCLTAAGIDCCVLANNHVLDWGHGGLLETLETLHRAGIRTAGAGRDADQAAAPAIIGLPGGNRLLVFAFATASSGVPSEWAAAGRRPGVNFLADLSAANLGRIGRRVRAERRTGDLVVISIHWGGNWGFEIPATQRVFARGLIDSASVDAVYGHSSHHVKGVEIYQGKPILYGCGDFLNDYEGIGGHETYRGDLALMYFPTLDTTTGRLLGFGATPTQIRHFRVNRAPEEGVHWLLAVLNREGKALGTRAERRPDGTFALRGP